MNIVSLIGRTTKDIECKYTAGDKPTAVAKLTLAVNRDKDHTDFIPVTVFGKQAENCEKYVKKGKMIGVEGRIQTGSYEKDGKINYTFDVIASRVEFLSGKSEGGEDNTAPAKVDPVPNDFEAIEDDIPF